MTAPPPLTVVTGAAGFLGRAVLRRLAGEAGTGRLVGCARATASWPPTVQPVQADLACPDGVARLRAALPPDEPVQLIHLAGGYLSPAHQELFDANVGSVLGVLEALGDQLGHVVYASSVAVYGSARPRAVEPDTEYGLAKWLAESTLALFTRASGVPVAVLRLASLYGRGNPGRNAVAALTTAIALGRVFTIGPAPIRARDYLHVDDAAEAVLAARGHAGTFDVGTGVSTSPHDLVDIARAVGRQVTVTEAGSAAPVARFACDPEPAREALGLGAPVPLTVGIADELEWRLAGEGRR